MDPRQKVAGPAIALMVTAGVGVLLQMVSLLMNILGAGMGATMGRQDAMVNMLSGAIGIVFNLIAIAMAGLVFYGATKMKKLESYGLAMAACIVAMVPCISPCCLLGLPIGIWALVVLMNQEVKAAFQKPPVGQ